MRHTVFVVKSEINRRRGGSGNREIEEVNMGAEKRAECEKLFSSKEPDIILRFDQWKNTLQVPFIEYIDFQCFTGNDNIHRTPGSTLYGYVAFPDTNRARHINIRATTSWENFSTL
jgi:hypothetical protein